MGMNGILNEPEGSPITVLSVQQYNQWKHKNSCKDDMLMIVYKDAKHRKKIRTIRNPKMEIYFAKPEIRDQFTTQREYLPIDQTYSKTVSAKHVLYAVQEELFQGQDEQSRIYQSIYSQAKQTGNWSARKEIYKWPYTLMSDVAVEDYYNIMLGYHYNTMRNHIVDKAYLDIENDVWGLSSSETAANMDPVNAVTVIFTYDEHREVLKTPEVYTFLLRNHRRYKDQKKFEQNIDAFIQKCHETLDHQIVTLDGKEKVIDFVADYHIKMYNQESDLLQDLFKEIHSHRPDTCSVWNIGYDLPKLAARLQLNGLNYVDVMCDPLIDKSYRFVELNVDRRSQIDIADRKTFIRTAGTVTWIDQMQSYAGKRKGMKAYGSNALDNISTIELGLGKHKFTKKGVNVLNAAIEDYEEFVYYNIIDVVRQVMIDMVTNDCMSMVFDMNQANTPLENIFKQTRYQKQIYYTNYLRMGYVPGNNPNVNYIRGETEEYLEKIEEAKRIRQLRDMEDEDCLNLDADDVFDIDADEELPAEGEDGEYDEEAQKLAEEVAAGLLDIYRDSVERELIIPGGLVGNPDLNIECGAQLVEGVYSKHVFEYIMDMDYASEYPWAKYTRSLSKSTQIGRLIIFEKISDRQNSLPMGQQKRIQEIRAYLPGAEFVADYISHDHISLGNVWFNLPTVCDMHKKLMERKKKRDRCETVHIDTETTNTLSVQEAVPVGSAVSAVL